MTAQTKPKVTFAAKPNPSKAIGWCEALEIVNGLRREHKLIDDELGRLVREPSGAHGTLQVMLGATRRIEGELKRLIGDLEEPSV